jgi:hypothetical protein
VAGVQHQRAATTLAAAEKISWTGGFAVVS